MYSSLLVCLDGSKPSLAGAQVSLSLATALNASLAVCHVYDAGLHSIRFREMEPVLPPEYRDENALKEMRDAHGSLILEGFQSMSRGYVERCVEEARRAGVRVREIHAEGRNYLKILSLIDELRADLVVVGAQGLGAEGDGRLGSTAARVLRLAPCDVLIARRSPIDGDLIVGIDGSPEALEALRKAAGWARGFGASLRLAAVYDPFFHNRVFDTMASSFSEERRREVALDNQKDLHKRIIDDGLGRLYEGFLEEAREAARPAGVPLKTELLQGKAYRALADRAAEARAGLVVVGRYGRQRSEAAGIGSNAEATAARAETNVLVTAPDPDAGQSHPGPRPENAEGLPWDEDALRRLEAIPPFVRSMARRAVEETVLRDGGSRVTVSAFNDLAERFAMSRRCGKDSHE